jgi:DNA-binding transcriptional MerR regulator
MSSMDNTLAMTMNVRSARGGSVHGAHLFHAQNFWRKVFWWIHSMEYIRSRPKLPCARWGSEAKMSGIDETALAKIERERAQGLTSAEILDVFAVNGIQLSEATLRKYVQLGLLPRSVRVGRKGKHQGSQGIYPVSVVRQIVRIKQMMAEDYTIEQIQREFLFMRSDLQALEHTLHNLFEKLDRIVLERKKDTTAKAVARDVNDARALSKDLLARLGAIESRLTSRSKIERAVAS